MADLRDLQEVIGRVAFDEARDRGLTVSIKTDLGPEVTVYDATKPPSNFNLVKFGVMIRDKDQKVIGGFGEYPATNWIKAGSLVLIVLAVGVAIARGMRK